MRIGKLRVNPQFVKQLIRPLVPVGILELMARRRYTPKSRRSAPRGTDDVPTPSAAHEYLSDHHQPTAVILYWSHHFGAVEALASFFKNALASLDVDVTMINIASDAELDAYALSGSGADFAIAVGSLPLAKRVLGRPLYEVFGEYFYVGHYSVAVPLMLLGRWTYADEGLLDRTHLRFFTRRTAIELMTCSGLVMDKIAWTRIWRRRFTMKLVSRFLDHVLPGHLSGFQFLIRVKAP